MNKDRRRVAIHRPQGFQPKGMYVPEKDASFKGYRVAKSKSDVDKAIRAEAKRLREEDNPYGISISAIASTFPSKKPAYCKGKVRLIKGGSV